MKTSLPSVLRVSAVNLMVLGLPNLFGAIYHVDFTSGSDANGGTAALPDGAAPGSPEVAGESSGCGCRTAPSSVPARAIFFALALLACIARRRR